MEACSAVEKEVEKVKSKFNSLNKTFNNNIDDQVVAITQLQRDIESLNSLEESNNKEQIKHKISQTIEKINNSVTKLATDHRELHSCVSKVGKVVDRNFVIDYDCTSREEVFSAPGRSSLLTNVILQHFYREGKLEIGETLSTESGITQYHDIRGPFIELNNILEALKARDLNPVLEWVVKNRDDLNKRGTTLLFSEVNGIQSVKQKNSLELRLHKLKFIELLRAGKKMDAIKYARANFPSFVTGQEKEVQSLMGAVMYSGPALEQSPYGDLLAPSMWQETADMFLRDACALLGLSMESPLQVAVNAGCVALPALLNIKQVMQQRHVSMWTDKDELPIEIDLGQDSRFHSVFACPILRQQITDNNPPMKLVCGHVISRDALAKLTQAHKLKCPYCPIEQNPSDARQIFF